jgi:hypothetical protein
MSGRDSTHVLPVWGERYGVVRYFHLISFAKRVHRDAVLQCPSAMLTTRQLNESRGLICGLCARFFAQFFGFSLQSDDLNPRVCSQSQLYTDVRVCDSTHESSNIRPGHCGPVGCGTVSPSRSAVSNIIASRSAVSNVTVKSENPIRVSGACRPILDRFFNNTFHDFNRSKASEKQFYMHIRTSYVCT